MKNTLTASLLVVIAGCWIGSRGVTARGQENPEAAAPPGPPPGATLIVPDDPFSGREFIEVRFANAVTAPDLSGTAVDAAEILDIDPALPAKFRWQSTRSGTLEPDGIVPLGGTYRISLRSGLTDAEGNEIAPPPATEVPGPVFRIADRWPRWFSRYSDHARQPRIALFFNDTTDPEAVGKAAYFRNANGARVAVTAKTPDEADKIPVDSYATGSRERQVRQAEDSAAPVPDDEAEAVESVVLVQPVVPLPPGKNWTLVVPAGIPNRGSAVTANPTEIEYGTIERFEWSGLNAEPRLNSPRELHVRFNKRLADLEPAEWAKWIEIAPLPPGAIWWSSGSSVVVAARFDLEIDYSVTVKEGMTAADGTVLANGGAMTARFALHAPRLSIPVFSDVQWLGGRGSFEMISANHSSVTLKVKRVDPDNAVFLLNGYRAYDNDSYRSEHTRIPYAAIAGNTVFQRSYPSKVSIDRSERFRFAWDEVGGGTRKPGIYFINVEGSPKSGAGSRGSARSGAQGIVQLTDIGLAWKSAGDSLLVYAFSHATGAALPGVSLTGFTDEAEPLVAAQTDGSGIATLNPEKAGWLLARKGEDAHCIPLDGSTDLNMWSFGVPTGYGDGEEPSRQLTMFTDRPVYQPGDTVWFKAITRLKAGRELAVPLPRTARLRLLDERNRTVMQRDVSFSDRGSLSDSVRLPAGSQGWFHLTINFPAIPVPSGLAEDDPQRPGFAGAHFQQYVMVQPYQPNAFRIEFDGEAAAQNGEQLEVPVRAAWLMGKPLDGAELTWSSRMAPEPFRSERWNGYRFGDSRSSYAWDGQQYHRLWGDEYEYDEYGESDPHSALVTGQGKVRLSDRGETLLAVPAPQNRTSSGPVSIEVDASITDLNQQTIAKSWSHTSHSSDWYLGVRLSSRTVEVGEDVPLELVALRNDGTRWEKPVQATALAERLVWNSVRIQTAGGGTDVRNDLSRETVGEGALEVSPEFGRESVWHFHPQTAGTHHLTFAGKDDSGRDVRTTVSVDVYGAGDLTWRNNNGMRIDLMPDRESYRPGETARIVVKSPFAGTALVSVECLGVLRTSLEWIEPGGVLELPVDEAWAPNVFVSVMHIRGGDNDPRGHREPAYRAGFCEIKVADNRNDLKVAVQPESPEVRPGATVKVKAIVTNHAGVPVPDAEVTLWAVDEGVLSLLPWSAPDVGSFFHPDLPLHVSSGIALQNLLSENPEEMQFANKGFVIGGGGDAAVPGDMMRRDFKATACWFGSLITGTDGVVEVSFDAPSNLSSFRIVAVAGEGAGRFGTGESSFRINKPLMLEPALPRFANVNDEVTLKAVLHNTTDSDAEVTVELTVDEHLTIVDPASRKPVEGRKFARMVSLAAQKSRAVPFPVKFVADGPVVLHWKATAAGNPALADAVESKFDVGFAEPLLREIRYVTGDSGTTSANLLADVRPELLEGRGEISITVSNSRVIEAAGAIEHLLRYPYGCAEQTMSSLMPWLTLRQLKNAIPGISKTDEEIAMVIQMGVDRLLSMQTAGGGVGYWPDASEPSFWASSHVAFGLTLARQAGASVPDDRMEPLLKWLSDALRSDSQDASYRGAFTDRAYAAFALAFAGKPEPAWHETLLRNPERLTSHACTLIALAIAESGGPEDLARRALAAAAAAPSWWWRSETVAAMRVVALQALHDPAAGDELSRLLDMRSARGDWNNTFSNAWALVAIGRDAANAPPRVPGKPAVVAFNGESISVELPATPASKTLTFPRNGPAPAELTLSVPEGTRAYARVSVSARPSPGERPARDQGFAIRRTWERVNPDGSLDPAGALRTGDLVRVTLDVDAPQAADYLAIDDPLPSTFEGVNPYFTSMASDSQQATARTWYTDYREVRRDRVLFFRNRYRSGGKFQLRYLARVVAEGNVMVPAAKIETMYDPSRFGLSAATRLVTGPPADDEVAAR